MVNRNEIAKFIKDSVEWLIAEQEGCRHLKLDNRLAILVGWSAGYGTEKRADIIQSKGQFDYAINVGIKVWTSDYMLTDYDWVSFPYDSEEAWDMGLSVPPNADYGVLADSMLEWYEAVKDLVITDIGYIIPEEDEEDDEEDEEEMEENSYPVSLTDITGTLGQWINNDFDEAVPKEVRNLLAKTYYLACKSL